MRPLFLTYSNGKEPYLTLANKLGEDVKTLYAGDFYHLEVKGPGNNMDFFAEVNGLLYPYIAKAFSEQRPVVMLDCDNGLVKSVETLFEMDFDIAAVFRYPQINEWGRQDYCSGLIVLNNRDPALIKKFWIEWTYKIAFWKQCDTGKFPQALKDGGWLASWFADQSALNRVILPNSNQGEPEEDSYKIVPGEVYEANGYRILPLERRLYGALPGDAGDAHIIHYKGKGKTQRLG